MVLPLYQTGWNTRAVLEGLTFWYRPRRLFLLTPGEQVAAIEKKAGQWSTSPIVCLAEESLFEPRYGLSKGDLAEPLRLAGSLYTPGWFFQQLLKMGAGTFLEDLSEDYLVWDADLLPVAPWPLFVEGVPAFALLQHRSGGNPAIVAKWAEWIRQFLSIAPIEEPEGTFVPHHLWFHQDQVAGLLEKVCQALGTTDPWPLAMMKSVGGEGTFSEFWAYSSWLQAQAPDRLAYHPYSSYGSTTERFFEDGTALFASKLARTTGKNPADISYFDLLAFLRGEYGEDALPSSLSFETSSRHLQKAAATLHLEETRSRWSMRSESSV